MFRTVLSASLFLVFSASAYGQQANNALLVGVVSDVPAGSFPARP